MPAGSRRLLALCALLASCGTPPPAARETSASSVATVVPAREPAAPSSPAAFPIAPATVIASRETNWPGIVAEVTEFVRKGSTLTAHVRFRNQGRADQIVQVDFHDVYVVDEAGAKKYSVLKDENGRALASAGGVWTMNVDAGAALTVWMKFPAAPPDVQIVALHLPMTQPFEDLTIENR